MDLFSFFQHVIDPEKLIHTGGLILILVVIFVESGIFFGFFLPGDSLLFTAGLLASQHYFNLIGIIIVAVVAAILGNNAGYYTGRKAGPTLFNRKNSLIFSQKRVREAHEFFE